MVYQTRGLPVENSEWSAFQVHLKNDCQFEELPCVRADCKEKVLRKDLRDHVEKACKYREATCSHCKSQVPMVTLQVRCPSPPPGSVQSPLVHRIACRVTVLSEIKRKDRHNQQLSSDFISELSCICFACFDSRN